MAGDSLPIDIDADASVAELKRRVHAANPLCVVAQQRMAVMHADRADGAHTALDDDARSLASYGVANDTVVLVFVAARELTPDELREHVRYFLYNEIDVMLYLFLTYLFESKTFFILILEFRLFPSLWFVEKSQTRFVLIYCTKNRYSLFCRLYYGCFCVIIMFVCSI